MTIQSEKVDNNTVVLHLTGRLDTVCAPILDRELKPLLESTTEIILDFKELSYVSSSGLHVLLQALKVMNASGRNLVIRNVCDSVRTVFVMTGLINLITLE